VNLSQTLPPGSLGLNRHRDCDPSGLEIPNQKKHTPIDGEIQSLPGVPSQITC